MITPAFMFTIFMLTLGPIKTVPAFFAMTQDQAPAAMRALAVKGHDGGDRRFPADCSGDDRGGGIMAVSPDDLRLAGGHTLVRRRARNDRTVRPSRIATAPAVPLRHPAVTPLAIPMIVTPWGVTAILFFADLAYGDSKMLAVVIGILVLIMLLNLVGMLLARQIIACVGMITFQVLGWIFAVLQAGLAVDAVVTSLRNLALFHPIP